MDPRFGSTILSPEKGSMAIIALTIPALAVCDRCGRPVANSNNVLLFDWARNPILSLFAPFRHLLPVIENGEQVCAGSPSRAQYLEGQPRDTRPEYAYDPAQEIPHREAYIRLQHLAASVAAPNN
jgi:hypothetical protein